MKVYTKTCPSCGAASDMSSPICAVCGRIYSPTDSPTPQSWWRRLLRLPFRSWTRRTKWDIALCTLEVTLALGTPLLLWRSIIYTHKPASAYMGDRIAINMSPEEVRAVLGEPTRVQRLDDVVAGKLMWYYALGDEILQVEFRGRRVLAINGRR